MYGRGVLGRWFRKLRLGFQERPNPGTDAERKINGAAGKAVADAVTLEAEGDPGLAVESPRWGFSC